MVFVSHGDIDWAILWAPPIVSGTPVVSTISSCRVAHGINLKRNSLLFWRYGYGLQNLAAFDNVKTGRVQKAYGAAEAWITHSFRLAVFVVVFCCPPINRVFRYHIDYCVAWHVLLVSPKQINPIRHARRLIIESFGHSPPPSEIVPLLVQYCQ